MDYKIKEYITSTGANPFREWLSKLDKKIKARIQSRVFNFERGNLGDYKSVGNGIFESRFTMGPGYRLYFAIEKRKIILLLLGGDKDSQPRDIKKAKSYWQDFKEL